MMVGGCGDGIVLGRTPHCLSNGSRGACEASAPVIPGWQRDIVDPDQKATMVKDLVAAFAKAARVSDVPDEAITTDTREPSYMFLAAEWNRSSVSERAYLLAMLFGREFEVEANDLSLQIASLAMTMGEPDGSAPLIARVDLGAASNDNVTRTMAAD
jgi:hypothetical protein